MRAARRVLERLEESLRLAVESVGHLLPVKLEPLEMAAELARAMDHSALDTAEGVLVPNVYRLGVAPEDRELLGVVARDLETELARALREHAADKGYVVGRRLRVETTADARLSSGRLSVEATFAEEPALARLTVVGGLPPQTYDVRGDTELGRGAECGVCLDEVAVSRRHARLHWTYPGYVIEDLGSVNGTFVGGEPIESRLLLGGEIIEIGLVQLRFEYLQD